MPFLFGAKITYIARTNSIITDPVPNPFPPVLRTGGILEIISASNGNPRIEFTITSAENIISPGMRRKYTSIGYLALFI
jgi:hypothetical protein